jgi:hypothetical protein
MSSKNKAEKYHMLSMIPLALGKSVLADYPDHGGMQSIHNVESQVQAGLMKDRKSTRLNSSHDGLRV